MRYRKKIIIPIIVLLLLSAFAFEFRSTIDAFINNPARSGLIKAVDQGDSRRVSELIRRGANVNILEGDFVCKTPLSEAVRLNNRKIAVELLAAGANPNIKADDWSPLMWACQNRSKEMVSDLMRAGADPNATSLRGKTPLMIASERGAEEIMDILCRGKADITLRDSNGMTAADYARKHDVQWGRGSNTIEILNRYKR